MMRTSLYKRLFFVACISAWLLATLPQSVALSQDDVSTVLLLTADGPITQAMAEYLSRGIEKAETEGHEALIFQLDTPGGEVTLMSSMMQMIRTSQVPVVVYVAPRGAMAGSAGALITLAGHASAMAPETAIGAASAVSGEGGELDETMRAKLENIMRAEVRSMTEARSPEAIALAEDMIEDALAVSATEALQVGLIDFIAVSVTDLLRQLEGFTVTVSGEEVILHTAQAEIEELNPTLIEQLLQMLTNPNIVFLLLSVGVQAVLIEISSPGGWVAGFIGVVCLALATYGLGILPVNWFGLAFIVTAFVLFILDIKAPTHGALTAAGVGSLIVGALVLFNSPSVPDFAQVSVPLVVGASLATGVFFLAFVMLAVRAQKAPIRTGQEGMVGRVGIARGEIAPIGKVQLGGELWSAQLAEGELPITSGSRIKVIRVEGVRLIVQKFD